MTASNFKSALKRVLAHEGGWANHPKDPGGATMKGVTQATYNAFRASEGHANRSVRFISNVELEMIYRRKYWDLVRADDLPSGVDFATFDYAVNSGPSRAVKDMQRALGCSVDGIIGPSTLRAVGAADDERLINDLCDRRLRFLKSLRTWSTFGNGWGRRVAETREAALSMVRGDEIELTSAPIKLADLKIAPKAPEADQAQLKTADGAGLSATTAGGVGQTVMERAQELQPHIGDSVLGRAAIAFFVLLMATGLCLLAYAQIKRVKEAGGLGGYIGSVFKV